MHSRRILKQFFIKQLVKATQKSIECNIDMYLSDSDPTVMLCGKEDIEFKNNKVIFFKSLNFSHTHNLIPSEIRSLKTIIIIITTNILTKDTMFDLLFSFKENPYDEETLPKKNGVIMATPVFLINQVKNLK